MWAQVCACPLPPLMVAPLHEWVSVGLELLSFLLGVFAIWVGFQLCGEWAFVVLAVARCRWGLSLDTGED
jgi:hypothetical protein